MAGPVPPQKKVGKSSEDVVWTHRYSVATFRMSFPSEWYR